jgi:Domain of unknown function (DUF4349)
MRLLMIAAIFSLAACGQRDVAYPADAASEAVASADVVAKSPMAGEPAPAQPGPTTGRYLAYEYSFTLELPSKAVGPVQEAQAAACRAVPANGCLVVGSSINRGDDGAVYGQLQMRMVPARVQPFRADLTKAVHGADGEITAATTNSEDLTQAIVDTEAVMRAKTALRERLLALLNRQTGKVADLLEVERELARVQQEIDAATSALKVYRLRTDLSLVTITFVSERSSVGGDVANPLAGAFRDFFRIMSYSAAGIVRVIAGILPLAVIGLPLVWLVIAGWRRWRARRKAS